MVQYKRRRSYRAGSFYFKKIIKKEGVMNKKHSKYLIPGIIVIGMVLRLPFTSIPPIINNIAEA